MESVQYNSSLSIPYPNYDWYRNGIRISDGDMYNSTGSLQEGLSLQITYNNTADVVGDYGINYYSVYDLMVLCEGYYNYFWHTLHDFYYEHHFPPQFFSLLISLWNVKGTREYTIM